MLFFTKGAQLWLWRFFRVGEIKNGGFQGGGEETAVLINIEAGRRRAPMYTNPGLIPVWEDAATSGRRRRRRALSTSGQGGGEPRCIKFRRSGPVSDAAASGRRRDAAADYRPKGRRRA